jgi:hypothetical protein
MQGKGMEVEATEIPALPETIEVGIPLVGSYGQAAAQAEVLALGGDSHVQVVGLGLEDRLELWPDSIPATTVPSSLLNPGSMWTVQGLSEKDDQVEVSIGRRGDRETSFLLPRERGEELETGALLAAPSEELFRQNWIFGVPKVLVEFRPDPGSAPAVIDTWLPILRLHCPQHPGCEAEYAISNATGTEASLELSLFGVGGGGGQSMTCTVSQSYRTGDECIEIAVPAKLVVQLGTTYVNGTQVAYGMRVTIKDVDPKALTERVLAPDHGCGMPFDEVKGDALWQLDRRTGGGGTGNQTWGMEIATETEGKLSLGIELGNVPLKLGIDYVRKTAHTTAVTTGVSPGARYASYSPLEGGGGFEVLWTC